jgi:hypothetical protein
VVVWESLTMRTVGPLALNDRLRAISRAAASLQPGLAERLGLRPEVAVRCFEKSSSVVSQFGCLLDNQHDKFFSNSCQLIRKSSQRLCLLLEQQACSC